MLTKNFIPMKLSWTSVKISIAGAKLSHLVQKDKIWDHGSMTEQVKNIFYKLKKVKSNGNIEDLRKYLSTTCYKKFENEFAELKMKEKVWVIKNLVIKEIAVIEVTTGNKTKPDCFTAMIKAMGIEFIKNKNSDKQLPTFSDQVRNFSEQWSFVREGEWWVLDAMK
jgi:predicted lipid-binding transport protein (Tim44 family)